MWHEGNGIWYGGCGMRGSGFGMVDADDGCG